MARAKITVSIADLPEVKAAFDRLVAERDALRSVLCDVLLDSWECSNPSECACSHARAARLLAGENQ